MALNLNNEKLKKALGEKFSFQIANAASSDIVIALLSANYKTSKANVTTGAISYNDATEIQNAGFSAVGAVLDDGTIATSVTASAANPNFTIRHFMEFVKHNPLVLKEMTVQASNADFFSQNLTVAYVSPLGDYGRDYIPLSDFFGVNQSSTTKIEIQDLNMPIDDTTLMYVKIPAGRTVSFTYKF